MSPDLSGGCKLLLRRFFKGFMAWNSLAFAPIEKQLKPFSRVALKKGYSHRQTLLYATIAMCCTVLCILVSVHL